MFLNGTTFIAMVVAGVILANVYSIYEEYKLHGASFVKEGNYTPWTLGGLGGLSLGVALVLIATPGSFTWVVGAISIACGMVALIIAALTTLFGALAGAALFLGLLGLQKLMVWILENPW